MNDDNLFCPRCLIHDHFFTGGGSWAPDSCPNCGGTACTMFKNLSAYNQKLAKKRFKRMWKEKHNAKD